MHLTVNGVADVIAGVFVVSSLAAAAVYLPWRMRDAYRQTFIALARAVESREPHLLGHAEKTARYVVLMARRCGMGFARTRRLENAALLHGLGKVSVPYGLLNSPACLTSPEDRFVLRDYVRVGAAILDAIPQLRDSANIVRYHHEYVDGSGYPYGRSTKDIPFEAQMVCVASEFIAMTTPRLYRAALSLPEDQAIAYLKGQAGQRYDRRAVRLFLKAKADEDRRQRLLSIFHKAMSYRLDMTIPRRVL